MTDTPKILRDMTDAEIGALVRAYAYRIAHPKFLPLEAGKVYRTADGWDRTCIAVRGDRAWLILTEGSAAYPHCAATGEGPHGHKTDVIGLSENQEAGQ